MPSHLSTIGFSVETEQQFWDLAQNVGPQSQGIPIAGGTYFQWTDSSGAELWLQVTQDDEFVGMNPHFVGQSRLKVRISNRIRVEEGSSFDGGFYGWIEPPQDDDGAKASLQAFVFDAPDFARFLPLDLPTTVIVQMAAFAHEVEMFATEAEFFASQSSEVKPATRMFYPAGLFRPDGVEEPLPEARALITGVVLAASRMLNTLSNLPYYWALIETHEGTFDAVIDVSLLSTTPTIGGILSGSFWLSGRIQASA